MPNRSASRRRTERAASVLRRFATVAGLLSSLLASGAFSGLQAQLSAAPKATFSLALDRTAYLPGDEARLAAVIDIEEGWHIQSHEPTLEFLIPTELTVLLPESWIGAKVEVDYPPHVMWQGEFADEQLAVYDGRVQILARFTVPEGIPLEPVAIEAELLFQACDERICVAPVTSRASTAVAIAEGGEAFNPDLFGDATTGGSAGAIPPRSLLVTLVLAVIGGLILNAMPCVLPVLSLKVFGLVQAASHGRREVTLGALATAAGIVVSFWALALAAIGARSAGQAAGWGVHFQNPGFVAFLTVVLVLFCLNLWGIFEIPLPRRLATAVSAPGPGHGALGHFAAGLFATLMATPCSAPFLGPAVGFALGQPAGTTLLVFTAVGIGMSLPYLLLAVSPGAAELLPRPGVWMENLKGVMGFLLAGTIVWLLFVLSAQISSVRLAMLEGTLLLLALFAWLRHRPGAGPTLRRVGTVGIVAAIAATFAVVAGGAGTAASSFQSAKLITWQTFDRTEAERLAREEGKLVFVDVTAEWCATCKFNEKLALETETVAELFERFGVIAMKADWTNRNDAIARYLADFGRYAIPFYVLYRPGADPHVFGELITKGAVVEAVEESAGLASSGS